MTPEDRVKALAFWSGPIEIAPLTGGITNLNYVVSCAGRQYVVRLGQDIPEHLVMRWNEQALTQAAAEAGISPALRHAEPGVMITDFITSTALSEADLHDPATLRAAVDLVARVHRDLTRRVTGPVLTFWVFHVLRSYASYLARHGSPHLSLIPQLMSEAMQLEEAVQPIDMVLGHNDLLPQNILRAEDRLWLVDWEYGGFNAPLFDLGGLASNAGLPDGAEQEMLGLYLGHTPDAAYLRRYGAMKCASLLREAMWSMVSELTSQIEFDYVAYTGENLARYRAALETWTAR
ncbi:phosphotransferase family protein [Citreicella sp. C3M06]|uniref:choline/ethanolamine kinase family protein n=1 Tax=Citreicella sp. C3M06 TaxID=2841564 RepID=UPI001C094E2B|nr:choline/ethanolamine kinase family protein [Citreicella sp. C3M06]MBU2963013.1 phosphotransferase family protein [Citreicella sp. C3M06]